MIDIPDNVKQLFKRDSVKKNLRIHFPNGEHDDINNDQIVQESAKFTESLCSRDSLKFGLCERSVFECDLHGIRDIKGSTIEPEIEIDVSSIGEYADDVFVLPKTYHTIAPWSYFNDNPDTINLPYYRTYKDWNNNLYDINNDKKYIYNPYSKGLYKLVYVDYYEDMSILKPGESLMIKQEDEVALYRHTDSTSFKYWSYETSDNPFGSSTGFDPGYEFTPKNYQTGKDKFSYYSVKEVIKNEYGILTDDKYELIYDSGTPRFNDKNQPILRQYGGVQFCTMEGTQSTTVRLFLAYANILKRVPYNNSGTYNYQDEYTYSITYKFLGDVENSDHIAYNYYHYTKKYYTRIAELTSIIDEKVTSITKYCCDYYSIYDVNGLDTQKTQNTGYITSRRYVKNPSTEEDYKINNAFNKAEDPIIRELMFKSYGLTDLKSFWAIDSGFPIEYQGTKYVRYEETQVVSKVIYNISLSNHYDIRVSAQYIGEDVIGSLNYEEVKPITKPEMIIYKYPEGTSFSPNVDFPYYPISYGIFKIEESELDDTYKKRHITAYTPNIIAEKLIAPEVSKLEYATTIKSAYIPNVVGFVCSQSHIDPEDFSTFRQQISMSQFRSSTRYRNTYIPASMTKATNPIWKGMRTEKYRYDLRSKPQNIDMPWIGSYTDPSTGATTNTFLKTLKLRICVDGYVYDDFSLTRNYIYRIKTNSTYLTTKFYKVLDDEHNDIEGIGHILEELAKVNGKIDTQDYGHDDIIRKVVMARCIKHKIGTWKSSSNSFSRDGIYPQFHIEIQKGTSGVKKLCTYNVEYGSVYPFGNVKINEKTWEEATNPDLRNNTKYASLRIPTKIYVMLTGYVIYRATYDIFGNLVTWKREYDDYAAFSKYKQVFSVESTLDGCRLDEFEILNEDDKKFVKKFDLPDPEQDETPKYDEIVDLSKLANDMLEIYGRFGYWNRQVGYYGSKHIIPEYLTDKTLPDGEVYPSDFFPYYPMSTDHHFLKEEYSSISLGDDFKPINRVIYTNHKDSADSTDSTESFECKYPEVINGSDDEWITINSYDLKDNQFFEKFKQTGTGTNLKDPAKDLAIKAYNNIKGIGYKPVSLECIGRPYLEAGDIFSFEAVEEQVYPDQDLYPSTNNRNIGGNKSSFSTDGDYSEDEEINLESVGYTSIAFRRTLSGIQHLRDSIESK